MSNPYDLNSHAIFEASAGTGKTYQVEQLVVQAIRNGTPLDKILVVTFTEKAAADLKRRLREAFARAHADAADPKLALALANYDSAQIFTIHAFCLRILQQFPFDHGQIARAQMVRDDEVMDACLREVQRTEWPKKFGDDLSDMMAIAGFDDDCAKWEQKISTLARFYRSNCGHTLKPGQADSRSELKNLKKIFAQEAEEIKRLVGPLNGTVQEHPLYLGYTSMAPTHWESRRRDILGPVLLWATDTESLLNPISAFIRMRNNIEKKKRFSYLAEAKNFNEPCTHLPAIAAKLELLESKLPQLKHALAVATVEMLHNLMKKYKEERGLQSFEDFLTRVAEALKDENPRVKHLIDALREKYSIAVVDEFQDTDRLQWEIFRRIFVDGTSEHRLVLVGDPKQAIYSFRNADVRTYLLARDDLKKNKAKVSPLDKSYRACKKLLGGFNALFGNETFFPSEGGINYSEVSPAQDHERPEISSGDDGRSAIRIVRFPSQTKGSLAQRQMARFVGDEIERLLHAPGGEPFSFRSRKGIAQLKAGDIAVLLFRRRESALIEEQLRSRKIPFTFYKQTGIWQSDEVVHLQFVLQALARCNEPATFRKMLLTRFFGVKPEDIATFEQSAPPRLVQHLFPRWKELCELRRWAELFRSILEDTGTLWHEFNQPDGSRRLANYRYITQELSRTAYQRGFSLMNLVELLQQKRLTSSDDESGLQPLETERPAVKLMTIHASKGLEFPIVFLAGGFTQKSHEEMFVKYHDNEKLIFDLDADESAKEKARAEEKDEVRRVLYVALTRPMLRLYVPALEKVSNSPGPIVNVLSPALEAANLPARQLADVVDGMTSAGVSSSPHAPVRDETSALEPIEISDLMMNGIDIGALAARRVELQSFSRMVHNSAPVITTALERPPRGDDDTRPEDVVKDLLPPGASAGDVLHTVLETVSFAEIRNAMRSGDLLSSDSQTRRLIEKSLRIHMPETSADAAVLQHRSRRVAELIWNTLRTPLRELGVVRLCDLSDAERIHEVEFHMPLSGRVAGLAEEFSSDGGFLTGWMDLVFTVNGRYFLLDWKSNTLPSYSFAELESDIRVRRYDLQYRIYLQALGRWLKRVRKKFDAQRDFGGVFYIYLRGMKPGEPESGVFFHRPTAEEWDEREFAKMLGQGSGR